MPGRDPVPHADDDTSDLGVDSFGGIGVGVHAGPAGIAPDELVCGVLDCDVFAPGNRLAISWQCIG